MGFDDICNTGLVLGLGFAATLETSSSSKSIIEKPSSLMAIRNSFEAPSLTLGLSAESSYELQVAKNNKGNSSNCVVVVPDSAADLSPHSHSAISSFSNATSIKRERDAGSEEVEAERVSNLRVNNDDDDDCCNTRKKLRLTKQQSAILEDSFKQHTTLNPKQKQALARQLNLRPRQVEVWFQNRRARTKLKQTEVDCEFLKKCCETLTDENRRLQKEVQELKALKLAQPLYMQLPAATLSMCPSCERIAGVGDVATNTPFALASKPHFYNPFTNPSAAC